MAKRFFLRFTSLQKVLQEIKEINGKIDDLYADKSEIVEKSEALLNEKLEEAKENEDAVDKIKEGLEYLAGEKEDEEDKVTED